ncbi:MAG TPA: hypothetical protein VHH88_13990 [Verrucomicrobiae bacterium]|nr:hypothetical protein [Verrucomicrobiae bacterium]
MPASFRFQSRSRAEIQRLLTTCFFVWLGFASHAAAQEKCRMVVFTPADLSVPADARTKLTAIAETTEKFYFRWMNHWKYPPAATNLFERESDGQVELLTIEGEETAASGKYSKPNFADYVIREATRKYHVPGKFHVWWIFVYLGDRPARFNDFAGAGNPIGGGWAMVNYDALPGACNPGTSLVAGYNGKVALKGMIHELGHAFGLPHQGPDPELRFGNTLMGPTTREYVASGQPLSDGVYLSAASAAMLWKHPLFSATNSYPWQKANLKLAGLNAAYISTDDSVSLSGKLVSDQQAHSVVVIDEPRTARSGYWNRSYAARVLPDGRFQLKIKHPASNGRIRILFCLDNGAVTGNGANFRFVNRGDIKRTYRFANGVFEFTN